MHSRVPTSVSDLYLTPMEYLRAGCHGLLTQSVAKLIGGVLEYIQHHRIGERPVEFGLRRQRAGSLRAIGQHDSGSIGVH